MKLRAGRQRQCWGGAAATALPEMAKVQSPKGRHRKFEILGFEKNGQDSAVPGGTLSDGDLTRH